MTLEIQQMLQDIEVIIYQSVIDKKIDADIALQILKIISTNER